MFATIAALLFVSCEKDEYVGLSKKTFNASIDMSAKSHLDGYNVVWDASDTILIGNGEDTTSYYKTRARGITATFACQEGRDIEGETYYAMHPFTAYQGHGEIALPATQNYRDNSMGNAPMYAVSNNHELHFHNLCGVLKLSLQKSNTIVYSIRITTDKRIVGVFPISEVEENGDTVYQVNAQEGNVNNTVELRCGSGVSIASTKDFYIYLPVGDYTKFEISILSTNESHADLNSSSSATRPLNFNRNHIKTLSRSGSQLIFESKYACDGIFSVSDEHTVFFAKGNLQWNNVNGTETWSFAANQYDYYTSETLSHHDHFTWPETHTNYGTNTYGQHTGCSHTFIDWGENVISGDLANTWRTLSAEEWEYLLFSRRTQGKMENDIPEFGKAYFTIGGVTMPLLVIYPDAMPANEIIQSQQYNPPSAGGQYDWEWGTNLTEADYNRLNNLGCAILPLSGYTNERQSGNNPQIVSQGQMARYASSTNNTSNEWNVVKYYLSIQANGYVQVGPNTSIVDNMTMGNAVRLVQNNY